MKFYEKLKKELKGKIPENVLPILPRSYNILGDILLYRLKPELYKYRRDIGKSTMKLLPYIKTVCVIKEFENVTRTPKIEVIAGNGTETVHKEYGCKFRLDVSKVMWSKGNKNEKIRLISLVKPGEFILDMFSGIGYWSIPIAKHTKASEIYAIDINPTAIRYLKHNIFLNEVENKVKVIKGDCRKVKIDKKFDRIIMGWLFETEKFLPYALKLSKKGTTIHMHRTVPMEKVGEIKEKLEEICQKYGFRSRISVIKIKNYAPRIWHVVYDINLT